MKELKFNKLIGEFHHVLYYFNSGQKHIRIKEPKGISGQLRRSNRKREVLTTIPTKSDSGDERDPNLRGINIRVYFLVLIKS